MYIVILCNGARPAKAHIGQELSEAGLFIAADGGARLAEELGLQPDLIVGDLDSYRPDPEKIEKAKIVHDPDQETNDLEKALKLALARGARRVTVFGATGKRLDHTLKNLSVLKQFHDSFLSIRFADSYGEMFLLPKRFRSRLVPGTAVSLVPLSEKVEGISTEGLRFPLRDESLQIGVRDGSSNEAVTPEISVTHVKGDLLIYIANHPEGP